MIKTADFEAKLGAYYRPLFALRHGLTIDSVPDAHAALSASPRKKHIYSTDIPFLSNHDGFRRIVLAMHDIMTFT